MNKIIEQSLARELIRLTEESANETYCLYERVKNNLEQTESYSNKKAITEILNLGLSVTTIVEYKKRNGDPIAEYLIETVFSNSLSKDIHDLFLNKLNNENIKNLRVKDIDSMYENYSEKDLFLEKIFSLGFDFKQGEMDEVSKAMSIDFQFFEACLKYKKDFKFSFKYEDNLTLDEILSEELHYLKNNSSHNSNEIDSFIAFLNKAKESEILKEQLNINLKNSSNKNVGNIKI